MRVNPPMGDGRPRPSGRTKLIGLLLCGVYGFSHTVVDNLFRRLRLRRFRRRRRGCCLRSRWFRRCPELTGRRCWCCRSRSFGRCRNWSCGLNWHNCRKRGHRNGRVRRNWDEPDRLAAPRSGSSSYPGIQNHGDNPRKTKLQNRHKQRRNVEVAFAKV